MPRSNSFCASALQEVSKWTLPSLSSSDWARTGWASDMPASTVSSESDALIMVSLPFSLRAIAELWTDQESASYAVSAPAYRLRHEIRKGVVLRHHWPKGVPAWARHLAVAA